MKTTKKHEVEIETENDQIVTKQETSEEEKLQKYAEEILDEVNLADMIEKCFAEKIEEKYVDLDSNTKDKLVLKLKNEMNSEPSGKKFWLECTQAKAWKYFEEDKVTNGYLLWQDGNLYKREVPGDIHDSASRKLTREIPALSNCALRGSTAYATANWTLEADECIIPYGKPNPGRGNPGAANRNGSAFPNVVIEVGDSQSLKDLHDNAQMWLDPNTTVEVAIVIKVFGKSKTSNERPMVALRYERGANPTQPTYAVSFGCYQISAQARNFINGLGGVPVVGVGAGGPACNANGIPMYQLRIPTAKIYNGDPAGIPFGAPNPANIDLYPIQVEVRNTPGY